MTSPVTSFQTDVVSVLPFLPRIVVRDSFAPSCYNSTNLVSLRQSLIDVISTRSKIEQRIAMPSTAADGSYMRPVIMVKIAKTATTKRILSSIASLKLSQKGGS